MEKIVRLTVKEISFDRIGQMVIVAQPNEYNPKGTYVVNAAQESAILRRANVPTAEMLKDLVDISNGTCTFEYTAKECKAGEAWTNEQSGQTGTYTKDWIQRSNNKINLGFVAKMKLTELRAQFAFAQATQRTVAAPARKAPVQVEQNDDHQNIPDPIV